MASLRPRLIGSLLALLAGTGSALAGDYRLVTFYNNSLVPLNVNVQKPYPSCGVTAVFRNPRVHPNLSVLAEINQGRGLVVGPGDVMSLKADFDFASQTGWHTMTFNLVNGQYAAGTDRQGKTQFKNTSALLTLHYGYKTVQFSSDLSLDNLVGYDFNQPFVDIPNKTITFQNH